MGVPRIRKENGKGVAQLRWRATSASSPDSPGRFVPSIPATPAANVELSGGRRLPPSCCRRCRCPCRSRGSCFGRCCACCCWWYLPLPLPLPAPAAWAPAPLAPPPPSRSTTPASRLQSPFAPVCRHLLQPALVGCSCKLHGPNIKHEIARSPACCLTRRPFGGWVGTAVGRR